MHQLGLRGNMRSPISRTIAWLRHPGLCLRQSTWATTSLLIGLLIGTSGCQRFHQHLGPKTIMADRLPYNNAVATSWKEQTLLNIVKVRYLEPPFFLDVPQIVSGYNLVQSADANIGLLNGLVPGVPSPERFRGLFGAGTAFSDRPTIAYAPQTASQFIVNLTAPIPPGAVMSLIEAGYSANEVLELSIDSINGLRNMSASGGELRPADPEFLWAIGVIRQAQLSGDLGVRVEKPGTTDQTILMQFSHSDSAPELAEDIARLSDSLQLSSETNQYSVVYGKTRQNENAIAIQTKPIYLMLRDLSPFVQVPAKHLAEGRAQSFDTSGIQDRPLMVHCGAEPPEQSFAAVQYRGCWFWINHGHLESKRTFAYLQLLLKLADTAPKEAKPTVTIQAN